MRIARAVRGQSGASLLEFAVAIAVIGVLATALVERLLYVQEYAEKVAMELTIANLRAGTRAQVGALLIGDKVSEIPTLADENPVDWLDRPPENYLGELQAVPQSEPKGQWYFDLARRELVYTANSRLHFSPSVYRDYTVRLRVMRIQNGERDSDDKQPVWVTLVVVNDYRWF